MRSSVSVMTMSAICGGLWRANSPVWKVIAVKVVIVVVVVVVVVVVIIIITLIVAKVATVIIQNGKNSGSKSTNGNDPEKRNLVSGLEVVWT